MIQLDVATGQIMRRATLPRAAWAVDLSPDGATALVGGAGGMIQALNLKDFTLAPLTMTELAPVEPLPGSDDAPSAAPATAFTAAPTAAPSAAPATAPAAAPATGPAGFIDSVGAVAFSPTGRHVLIGGADQMFAVIPWPRRGAGGGFAKNTSGRVMAACFTADGTRVLVAVDRDLFLLDAASGSLLRQMPPSTKLIAAVAIAPDGNTAASASYDHTIRLWDLEKRLTTKVLTGHLGWVRAVAFLPDGKTVVSAGEDNTVRLWDAQSGKELRTFTGHTAAVCSLAISPDGATILSGSVDGTIRKWDLTRPLRYRVLETDLLTLHNALDSNADDAGALRKLGDWYAFNGRDDWAVECLERARASGAADVSPLVLARCYWKLDRLSDAAREFRRVRPSADVPAAYLDLCLTAVSR